MILQIILITGFILFMFLFINQKKSKYVFYSKQDDVSARHNKHSAKVNRIASLLKERKNTMHISIKKKAVSHQVPKAKDLKYSDDKLNISDLNELIEIDMENMICTAEPGITFVDLVKETMRYGLSPIIVPEFKTITIGGAVAGCSIESASFIYGGFHDTCIEYEIVTATGKIMTCTPENENKLLFQMVHGTFGTVGVLTRLKFKLIPAKPYVRVNYEKYANLNDYNNSIKEHFKKKDVDFMDGIIHSQDEYVLCVGKFTDEAPYLNNYNWMKVYYKSTRERDEDYLSTIDYYFRYNRGVTNVHPKSAIGRFLFGKFISSSEVLRIGEKLRRFLSSENPTIHLDIFIPFSKVSKFIEWYSKDFNFFPLWCVPYKRVRDYEWLSDRIYYESDDELFLDLAIYGMKQKGDRNYHKIMEDKLLEIGGVKTLISYNYFSEEDFWKIWNRENYFKVKSITDPNNIFRDLYTKMCKATRGIAE